VRLTALHLGKSAIDEELDSGDVTRVVGGEKHRGLGDFIGRAEAADGRRGINHLPTLFSRRIGIQQAIQARRID